MFKAQVNCVVEFSGHLIYVPLPDRYRSGALISWLLMDMATPAQAPAIRYWVRSKQQRGTTQRWRGRRDRGGEPQKHWNVCWEWQGPAQTVRVLNMLPYGPYFVSLHNYACSWEITACKCLVVERWSEPKKGIDCLVLLHRKRLKRRPIGWSRRCKKQHTGQQKTLWALQRRWVSRGGALLACSLWRALCSALFARRQEHQSSDSPTSYYSARQSVLL